jgi:hypothetical protein
VLYPLAFLLPRNVLVCGLVGLSHRSRRKSHHESGTSVASLNRALTVESSAHITILFEGRLLSSNIDELNRMAPRLRRFLAGSGRETLISQAGDFFALRSALIVRGARA